MPIHVGRGNSTGEPFRKHKRETPKQGNSRKSDKDQLGIGKNKNANVKTMRF